mgnify:FL=1
MSGIAAPLMALAWMGAQAVPAPASPPPPVQAEVERSAEGVLVRYRLPAPVESFVFEDKDVIRTRWRVSTQGLTLQDGVVTGDAPFSSFELQIAPDAAEVDRIYVGLSRAGDGYVVYGPALRAEGQDTRLQFSGAASDAALPTENAIAGYAFVGPADHVGGDEHGVFVARPDLTADLAQPIRSAFVSSMAFYQARLGLDLPYRPAIVVSTDSPGPSGFRGDVTDTGVISVRFHGDSWRYDPDAVAPFVWHEVFHLWNGHSVVTRDGDTAPWLHEGGAEYAALAGAVSSGAMSEARARTALADRLNGCRRAIGVDDLDQSSLRSGGAVYDCGTLVQWLADLELRQAGAGDVFSVWRDVLGAGRRNLQNGYGVADFEAALPTESAARSFLKEPGEGRWRRLQDRMARLGVRFVNAPGPNDLRVAALFHVAAANCQGSYGFYDEPGALKLDGDRCGPLSGGPVIDAVEGFDPQQESAAMFDAVQKRCADKQPVRYLTREGAVLEAACDAPLETPQLWAVAEAPPLRR